MIRVLVAALALVLAVPAAASLQPQKDDSPDAFGARLDAALFDAYNACDLAAFGALLDEGVEFYHDKGGLMVGRQPVVDAVKNNICGKVRRELVPGSLHSYPMDNYGLLQTGEHRFCPVGGSRCEGVARFTHLWKRGEDGWHVTRILSYDHQPLPQEPGAAPAASK